MSTSVLESILIDVRPIPKPQRHPLIFNGLDTLAVGQILIVQNDHNPIPLCGQVESIYGDQFTWQYLDEGPQVFRLQFTRRIAAPEGWGRKNLPSAEPARSPAPTPVAVDLDLLAASQATVHSGPQWAHECEDLDMTLLSWKDNRRIEAHVNNEVDVIMIGVEGTGVVTVDGVSHEMHAGRALLIPKGCERAIEGSSERFSYLSVHKRRRGLVLHRNGKPLPV